MSRKSDPPLGSAFSPSQIELPKLLEFADTHSGDWRVFEEAISKRRLNPSSTPKTRPTTTVWPALASCGMEFTASPYRMTVVRSAASSTRRGTLRNDKRTQPVDPEGSSDAAMSHKHRGHWSTVCRGMSAAAYGPAAGDWPGAS